MRFIPIDKMKKLREASKNGDETAKKILKAQLNGTDFDSDLDIYFKPKPEPVSELAQDPEEGIMQTTTEKAAEQGEELDSGLVQFLKDNEITKESPEYNDFVEDYYRENPKARPIKELNLSNATNSTVAKPEFASQEVPVEELDLTKDMAESLINIISSCDKTMVAILNNDDIEDTTKKGIITTLQEIKNNILDNFDKVKKIKKSLTEKKDEATLDQSKIQENIQNSLIK